jgi:AcrR family transcriptional regulator
MVKTGKQLLNTGVYMPRTKKTNEQIKEARKEKILSGALKVFAVRGLSATKIADIAAASGMSQGLVYHYFQSKEAIYTELIRFAFSRMNSACRWLENHTAAPEEKIRIAIEELFKGFEEKEETSYYYLLIAQATMSAAVPEEVKRILSEESIVPYNTIHDILIEGQKKGTIRMYDARDLALLFWTSIKGLAVHKAVHGAGCRTPEPRILMDMFITHKGE